METGRSSFLGICLRLGCSVLLPISSHRLVFLHDLQLVECCRESGENTIGMVAWRVKLRTPEFPGGRTIYVLANDITVLSGSFAVQEDLLFQKVSELARSEGAPRIFLSANSGARLGLDDLLKRSFNVKWKDRESVSATLPRLSSLGDVAYSWSLKTPSVVSPFVSPFSGTCPEDSNTCT